MYTSELAAGEALDWGEVCWPCNCPVDRWRSAVPRCHMCPVEIFQYIYSHWPSILSPHNIFMSAEKLENAAIRCLKWANKNTNCIESVTNARRIVVHLTSPRPLVTNSCGQWPFASHYSYNFSPITAIFWFISWHYYRRQMLKELPVIRDGKKWDNFRGFGTDPADL